MIRKYTKKLQKLNSVYGDRMAVVCELLSFAGVILAVIVCTVLVCIIVSPEVDMSDLQKAKIGICSRTACFWE